MTSVITLIHLFRILMGSVAVSRLLLIEKKKWTFLFLLCLNLIGLLCRSQGKRAGYSHSYDHFNQQLVTAMNKMYRNV